MTYSTFNPGHVVESARTPDSRLRSEMHPSNECIAAVDALENRTRATASANPKFSWGASKVHMAKVIKGCCCGEDTPGSQ